MINIDDLIGVRYKDNGRDIKNGLDCFGLAIEVCKRFGHELPDLSKPWKMNKDFDSCEHDITSVIKVKEVTKPEKEGDVILMKNVRGVMHHVGVYMGNGRFIHCNKFGVHIDKIINYEIYIGRVYTWL